MTTPLQSVLLLRDASSVSRYHTVRTHRQQSVADHSHGVAMLMLRIHPSAAAHVLRAALCHDLAEVVTGDLPAPVKWANPVLKELLAGIEVRYEDALGISTELSEDEMLLLKWCDTMELVLWSWEEVMMGNSYAIDIVSNGVQYVSSVLGHPNQTAALILKELQEELPMLARYEQMKRQWIAAHPQATPQQYEAAMRAIARKCGV